MTGETLQKLVTGPVGGGGASKTAPGKASWKGALDRQGRAMEGGECVQKQRWDQEHSWSPVADEPGKRARSRPRGSGMYPSGVRFYPLYSGEPLKGPVPEAHGASTRSSEN